MRRKRVVYLATEGFQLGCLELLPFVIRFIDYMWKMPDTSLYSIDVSGDEMTVMFNCSRHAGRMGAIFMSKDGDGYNGFVPVITEYRLLDMKQVIYQRILDDYFFSDFDSFLCCYEREV